MRFLHTLFILISISLGTSAQSAEDFNQAGKNLFEQLTHPEDERYLPMIRVGQYRQLIDLQDWDEEKKLKRKYQVDQSYSSLYLQWQESVEGLQREYLEAMNAGAEMKYLNTRYFPNKGLSGTYSVETSFVFRTSTVQSEVILSYELAWLPEIGLRLMSTVEEGF